MLGRFNGSLRCRQQCQRIEQARLQSVYLQKQPPKRTIRRRSVTGEKGFKFQTRRGGDRAGHLQVSRASSSFCVLSLLCPRSGRSFLQQAAGQQRGQEPRNYDGQQSRPRSRNVRESPSAPFACASSVCTRPQLSSIRRRAIKTSPSATEA